MNSNNEERGMPRRILIVRLGAMGDVLHAMPAVAALRAALPECEFGWVIEERWAELLCTRSAARTGEPSPSKPLIDRLHTVDTRGWRRRTLSPNTWSEVSGTVRTLRRQHYDLAIDFQGAIKSSVIAALSSAERIEGFLNPREGPARLLYTHSHGAEAAHVIDQNLELASAAIEKPLESSKPVLPLDAAAEAFADEIRRNSGERLALLNPGAGWGAKQWPAASYAAVARVLRARGIAPLINFGPGERDLAEEVARLSEGAATPVNCDLSHLIALTRRASLFIGGDTGPLHLAAALRVPVVALFGPTDPERNGPYGTHSVVLRSVESQTSYSHVAERDTGLESITPEQVLEAAGSLLENE